MDDELHKGDRVYNPRFGRGDVVAAEWIGDYQRLTIRFESGQELTVRDPAALRLEKIEEAPRAAPAGDGPGGAPAPAAAPAPEAGEGEEMDRDEMRSLFVEALEEVCGPARAGISDRWQGGKMVLHPGRAGTQSKELPLDKFFQKIIRLRDQLRVLEQKINAHPALDDSDKLAMQQYITRCYGTLTTFNVLFKDADDRFVGAGGGA